MSQNKEFVIRCRAIIVHNGEMLLVRHSYDKDFLALPGGHLEWGEDVKECLEREIIEELGVKPKIGKLLYINTFKDGENIQPMEFFFEVTNGKDYINCEELDRTHAHELVEIVWVANDSDAKILPKALSDDFYTQNMFTGDLKFIRN